MKRNCMRCTALLIAMALVFSVSAVQAGAVFGMLSWGALSERHGGPAAFAVASAVAAAAALAASRIDRGAAPAPGAGARAPSQDLV